MHSLTTTTPNPFRVGCEHWTIHKLARNYVEAAEMWFYRHISRTSWADKKRYDDILKNANLVK